MAVVGIIKDFHTESLNQPIGPMAIYYRADLLSHLGVRIKQQNVDETLAFLKQTWHDFLPERPFEFYFLSDEINSLYQRQQDTAWIVGVFSILALFVGGLGLFALCQFSVQRRQKEIAVRKVLGAGVSNIVFRLSEESALLVIVSNIIAWPIAYFLTTRWLENFAYQMDLKMSIFILAGLFTLIIALITVCSQAIKAAHESPVDALRNE